MKVSRKDLIQVWLKNAAQILRPGLARLWYSMRVKVDAAVTNQGVYGFTPSGF